MRHPDLPITRLLGGFPDAPILEDLMFSERLRAAARPVMLDAQVIADSRRFVQMGIARSLLRVLDVLVCYELRMPIPARAFFSAVR